MAEPQAEPQAETPTVPTTPQSQSRASIRYPSPPPLHAPSGPSRSHKSGRAGGRSPGGCLHPRCCARDASAWRSMHFLEMWLAQATRVWHPSTPGHACSGHLIQPSSLSLSLCSLPSTHCSSAPQVARVRHRARGGGHRPEAHTQAVPCRDPGQGRHPLRVLEGEVWLPSPLWQGFFASRRPSSRASSSAAPCPRRGPSTLPQPCECFPAPHHVRVCARASPASPLRPAPVLGLGFERRFY